LDKENTIEETNKELINYLERPTSKKFIQKQERLLTKRPSDSEWQPFDMVISQENGTHYINFHNGDKIIRFKEDK